MSNEEQILEELKAIREALTSTPPPKGPEKKKNLLEEFKEFIKKYQVLGLAVAFIMAQYLGALVKSLVDNLVMPIVTIFLPTDVPWEQFVVWRFGIGSFIGDLITFIIVAFVIFLLVKYTAKIGIE